MKRATALTLSTLIIIIILMVALLSLLIFFRTQFGSSTESIDKVSTGAESLGEGVEDKLNAHDLFCTIKPAGTKDNLDYEYRWKRCWIKPGDIDSDEKCCTHRTGFLTHDECAERGDQYDDCRCINCPLIVDIG